MEMKNEFKARLEDYIKKNNLPDTMTEDILSLVPKSTIEKVHDFSDLFGAAWFSKPHVPPKDILKLRFSLMFEELMEWVEACGIRLDAYMIMTKKLDEWVIGSLARQENSPDLVEALDALLDMRYVNDGTILAMGLQNVFGDSFHEVHSSNMSKICSTEEEALETVDFYKNEMNKDTYHVAVQDKWVVLRKEDSKVLKSIKYFKPDLKQFIINDTKPVKKTSTKITRERIKNLMKDDKE